MRKLSRVSLPDLLLALELPSAGRSHPDTACRCTQRENDGQHEKQWYRANIGLMRPSLPTKLDDSAGSMPSLVTGGGGKGTTTTRSFASFVARIVHPRPDRGY